MVALRKKTVDPLDANLENNHRIHGACVFFGFVVFCVVLFFFKAETRRTKSSYHNTRKNNTEQVNTIRLPALTGKGTNLTRDPASASPQMPSDS